MSTSARSTASRVTPLDCRIQAASDLPCREDSEEEVLDGDHGVVEALGLLPGGLVEDFAQVRRQVDLTRIAGDLDFRPARGGTRPRA